MHEISLARNIFKTLEEEFRGDLDKLRVVHLSAGLLSNVQPLLMQSAFQAVLEAETCYANISLQVEVLPILMECSECGKITEVQQYKFVCGHCGKPGGKIVQGEELVISKVEFSEKCEI
jgi:hydrogenase nickel incorporation protein HypA/HybF